MGNDVTKLPPIKQNPSAPQPAAPVRRVKTMSAIRLDDDMSPHPSPSPAALDNSLLADPAKHNATTAERLKIVADASADAFSDYNDATASSYDRVRSGCLLTPSFVHF